MRNKTLRVASYHNVREEFACGDVIYDTYKLRARMHGRASSATDEKGKSLVYLLYGTAHRDSLTEKFVRRGIVPHMIANDSELTDDRFLDKDPDFSSSNTNRRIGMAVLAAFDFDLAVESYHDLDYLNRLDGEEFTRHILFGLQVLYATRHQ